GYVYANKCWWGNKLPDKKLLGGTKTILFSYPLQRNPGLDPESESDCYPALSGEMNNLDSVLQKYHQLLENSDTSTAVTLIEKTIIEQYDHEDVKFAIYCLYHLLHRPLTDFSSTLKYHLISQSEYEIPYNKILTLQYIHERQFESALKNLKIFIRNHSLEDPVSFALYNLILMDSSKLYQNYETHFVYLHHHYPKSILTRIISSMFNQNSDWEDVEIPDNGDYGNKQDYDIVDCEIFPNPIHTHSRVTIFLFSPANIKISIFDLQGQKKKMKLNIILCVRVIIFFHYIQVPKISPAAFTFFKFRQIY
ncbi:MAG: hypothetical protein JXQ65_14500, partial [Candidatus Marinimicrobia bacterium]|nr:hypothetical protein [Candidatus Neomarinimicrobiota bacterium]